jgi:hypothetical protein
MFNTFSLVFLAALLVMCALRLWLAQRQITHVMAHRGRVPENFADRVDLKTHQKAADYTVARSRFGRVGLAVEVAMLLAFTLGGGLQILHDFWSARLDGLPYGVALIFSVLLISAIVDLPLGLYHQFVIEEEFSFNRMTLRIFLADHLKQAILAIVIGTPVLLAVLWLMARMGELWWLYVWLFWCAFNLLLPVRLSDLDRAAIQQVRPARRCPTQSARRGTAGTLRLRQFGPLRDGRIEAVEPRQRLLHRFRQDEAHRLLRHLARPPAGR